MSRGLTIFLLSFLTATVLSAQGPAVFKGTVCDEAGDALQGANVVAFSSDDRTLSYSITDDKGGYSLRLPPEADRVTFSFMGMTSVTVAAGDLVQGQTVTLAKGEYRLKTVTVKAAPVSESGDTLTYSVAGFREAQDRSIADVIRKMPGLEVRPDGAIEYQGKAIGKFYIEGLDLMGGQYSLASNNIQAAKVKEVQVLENHQAVKSLRGVSFSEQAALNLVLEEDAKAVWTGLVDAGAGYAEEGEGFQYDSRLMAMRFSRKFQSLMLYKCNNTGTDIGAEVVDLASFDTYKAENGIIDMVHVSSPDFSRDRYTFNASHLLAGNWLWKTGKDSQVRFQIDGFLDRERMRTATSMEYLDIDGVPSVTEDWNVTGRRNEVKGSIDYTLNSARTYIRSRTHFSGNWNSSLGNLDVNGIASEISVRPFRRVFSEDFSLSHTTGRGNVWQVKSSTGDTWLPSSLMTASGDLQQLGLNLFSTCNSVSFNLKTGQHRVSGKAGVDYRRQNLDGNVWSFVYPYYEHSVQFVFSDHRLTGSVRTGYAHQRYNSFTSGHFMIEPAVNWNWKPDATSELKAGWSMSARPLEGGDILDTPVFVSFRQKYSGSGRTGIRTVHSLTGSYTYRNPLLGLFFNIRPLYMHSNGNILYESTMASEIYVKTATDRKYSSNTFRTDARIAKSFIPVRLSIGLNGSASSTSYDYLSLGDVVRTRMNVYSASLDFSLRPASWITLEGSSAFEQYRRNGLKESALPVSKVNDWTHNLKLNLLPLPELMVSLANELYHSSEKDFGLNWFCDVSIGYKAKKWELSLAACNLAGVSEYRRVRVTSTMRSYTLTYLRPRSYVVKFSIDL